LKPNTHLDPKAYWGPQEVDFEVRRLLARLMAQRHGRRGNVALFTPNAEGLEAGIEYVDPRSLTAEPLEIQTFNTFEDLLLYYLTEAIPP